MNLFPPGRLVAIGRSLRPVIGLFLRVLLVVVVALAVAVIVNLRHSLIGPDLKVGPGVILLLLGSTVMHIIYAFGVSAVYRLVFDRPKVERTRGRSALYIVGAIVPAVFMNLLLLQILVFSDFGTIFRKTYWLDDFPFFFVPLLAYVLAVLYWPPARLYMRKHITDKEIRATTYLDSWLKSRKMFFLMNYLDLVYGSSVIYQDSKVDVLMISLEGGVYFFILRDGTKVATSLNSVDIEKWLLSNWFFTASRWTYVNMLYVQVPEASDKVLKLTHSVNENIRDKNNYAKISSGLNVNRKQQHKLGAFLLGRKSLPHEGWDEMIGL
ncbi:MAG: hypothetical protein LBE37_16315 [Sphingobacterium sp.]|jgi:hypothetical protein|nr:hypothetical protein [Sphingobacterium sp.]